jgi:hypothetical protein
MEGAVYIEFLHPECMEEDGRTAVKDIEVTVVHELLHLRFFYCLPNHEKDEFLPHVEQAIETTAIAMVAAKRGVSIKEIV